MELPFDDDEYCRDLMDAISIMERIADGLIADIKAKESSDFFSQLETALKERKYCQIKLALKKIKNEFNKMISEPDHNEDEEDEYEEEILWDKWIYDKDFPGNKGFFSEDEFPEYDEKYRHVISDFTLPRYHNSDDEISDDESQGDDIDDNDDYGAMLYDETMDPRGYGNDNYED